MTLKKADPWKIYDDHIALILKAQKDLGIQGAMAFINEESPKALISRMQAVLRAYKGLKPKPATPAPTKQEVQPAVNLTSDIGQKEPYQAWRGEEKPSPGQVWKKAMIQILLDPRSGPWFRVAVLAEVVGVHPINIYAFIKEKARAFQIQKRKGFVLVALRSRIRDPLEEDKTTTDGPLEIMTTSAPGADGKGNIEDWKKLMTKIEKEQKR